MVTVQRNNKVKCVSFPPLTIGKGQEIKISHKFLRVHYGKNYKKHILN